MTQVVLGLGANRPFGGKSCVDILCRGVQALGGFLDRMIFSSVYKTGAMYVTDQDDFYNMAVTGLYKGSPEELLRQIHVVEAAFGRDRSREIRNGPRSLDIDIELFGETVVKESDLVIPHERISERAFVLVPVLEILERNADVFSSAASDCKEPLELVSEESISFYRNCLLGLGNQRVELCVSQEDFAGLVAGTAFP